MRINGKSRLDIFMRKHADARGPLISWLAEAEKAQWHTSQDIKSMYPAASFLHENRVVFNIKGNSYRLVVKVMYPLEIVLIVWIGTHPEYQEREF